MESKISAYMPLDLWFSNVIPGAATSQIAALGPHPRLSESETLRVGPAKCGLTSLSGDCDVSSNLRAGY